VEARPEPKPTRASADSRAGLSLYIQSKGC
jgi:hypothetical protein